MRTLGEKIWTGYWKRGEWFWEGNGSGGRSVGEGEWLGREKVCGEKGLKRMVWGEMARERKWLREGIRLGREKVCGEKRVEGEWFGRENGEGEKMVAGGITIGEGQGLEMEIGWGERWV